MMETLENAGADIVIFGDVFTSFEEQKPDSQTVREITSLLQNIKAPLGKFAVLGDEDLVAKKPSKKSPLFFITVILKLSPIRNCKFATAVKIALHSLA